MPHGLEERRSTVRSRGRYGYLHLRGGTLVLPAEPCLVHQVAIVLLEAGRYKVRCRHSHCSFKADHVETLEAADRLRREHLAAVSGKQS